MTRDRELQAARDRLERVYEAVVVELERMRNVGEHRQERELVAAAERNCSSAGLRDPARTERTA